MQYVIQYVFSQYCAFTELPFTVKVTIFLFIPVQKLTVKLEIFLGNFLDTRRTYRPIFSIFSAFWDSYKGVFVSFPKLDVQNQVHQGCGLFCNFLTTFIIADVH